MNDSERKKSGRVPLRGPPAVFSRHCFSRYTRFGRRATHNARMKKNSIQLLNVRIVNVHQMNANTGMDGAGNLRFESCLCPRLYDEIFPRKRVSVRNDEIL